MTGWESLFVLSQMATTLSLRFSGKNLSATTVPWSCSHWSNILIEQKGPFNALGVFFATPGDDWAHTQESKTDTHAQHEISQTKKRKNLGLKKFHGHLPFRNLLFFFFFFLWSLFLFHKRENDEILLLLLLLLLERILNGNGPNEMWGRDWTQVVEVELEGVWYEISVIEDLQNPMPRRLNFSAHTTSSVPRPNLKHKLIHRRDRTRQRDYS